MSRADVPPRRDPTQVVRWSDVFQRLTNWTNRPVEREILRTHLQHRWFAPDDPETVDSLINDAVATGILTEGADDRLEYGGRFIVVSLSAGGEARITIPQA